MATNVRPAVEAIWRAMGLAMPPEPIGPRFDFVIEDTDVVLQLAPNGQTILVEASLGALAADPIKAGDQLRALLRIGLALGLFNRAALSVPQATDTDALAALVHGRPEERPSFDVRVVATIGGDTRRDAIGALQDVLQWRAHSDPILDRASARIGDEPARLRPQSPSEADFVIFQP